MSNLLLLERVWKHTGKDSLEGHKDLALRMPHIKLCNVLTTFPTTPAEERHVHVELEAPRSTLHTNWSRMHTFEWGTENR